MLFSVIVLLTAQKSNENTGFSFFRNSGGIQQTFQQMADKWMHSVSYSQPWWKLADYKGNNRSRQLKGLEAAEKTEFVAK